MPPSKIGPGRVRAEERIPAPPPRGIAELRVNIGERRQVGDLMPAIRDTVMEIGQRLSRAQRAPDGQHPFQEIQGVVRLRQERMQGDLLWRGTVDTWNPLPVEQPPQAV